MRLVRSPQALGTYVGVALVAGAAVALGVVLTRLFSAVLGHHFAFLAISLALFGVGLGGGLLAVFPGLARPPRLFARLATFAGLAGLTSVVAVIQVLRTKAPESLDGAAMKELALLYASASLPFTFVGLTVAALLAHARLGAARIYMADMIGASVGGALSMALLRAGAPRAGLLLAIVFGVASVLFALAGRSRGGPVSPPDRGGGGWVAAACLLSSISLLLGDVGAPYLKLPALRYVNLDRAAFVSWGELALVTVDKPVRGMAWMRMDGSAATAILDDDGSRPKHPDELPYVLSGKEGPTLVIGAGGGRDVRAALDAGQTEVHAVEVNRTIANEVMLGAFREFSGGLYARPEVRLVVADGRHYVRSSDQKYRSIVLSLVDTWSAASVGGLALSEDALYTVEAFHDYLTHLDDDGALLVNRWDQELERLLALAGEGLRSVGAEKPSDHLFACTYQRTTALLVARQPLGEARLKKLRKHCKKSRFPEVFAPDQPGSPRKLSLVDVPGAARAASLERNIEPPTDDRPFFFYDVPAGRVLATLKDQKRVAEHEQGLGVLVGVLLVSLAFSLLVLGLPLLVRPRQMLLAPDRAARARALVFFGALGAGFVWVELALVQALTTFLGHPTYALSVVLTALLGGTGLGAYWVRRVSPAYAPHVARARALTLVVVLVVASLGLTAASGALVGLPLALRVALAVLVLAPIGALAGAQLPLGALAAGRRSPDLVTWGFGLNGFVGVAATALGTLLAMHVGYSFLLLLGAVAYYVAAGLAPSAPAGHSGGASSRSSVPAA